MRILRGEQSGSIVINGIKQFDTYDYFCTNHPTPKMMIPVVTEEWLHQYEDSSELFIHRTLSKSCQRCHQIIEEGGYFVPVNTGDSDPTVEGTSTIKNKRSDSEESSD